MPRSVTFCLALAFGLGACSGGPHGTAERRRRAGTPAATSVALRTCTDAHAGKGFTGLPRLTGASPRQAIRFVGYPDPRSQPPAVRAPEFYGHDGRFQLLKVLVVAATNTTVTVVVPRVERGKVSLLYDTEKLDRLPGTGEPVAMSQGGPAVTFQGCNDPDIGFPGYFLVDGPRCVRLDLHLRDEVTRVSLPFGVRDC